MLRIRINQSDPEGSYLDRAVRNGMISLSRVKVVTHTDGFMMLV